MANRVLVILLVTGVLQGNSSADFQSEHPQFHAPNLVIEGLHEKGNGTFVKHLHSDDVEDVLDEQGYDDNVAEDLRSAEDELQDLHSDGVEEISGGQDNDDDGEESLRTDNDGEQDSSLRTGTSADVLIDVPVKILRSNICLKDAPGKLKFSARGEPCGHFTIKRAFWHGIRTGFFLKTPSNNGYLVYSHGQIFNWKKRRGSPTAKRWLFNKASHGKFYVTTYSSRRRPQRVMQSSRDGRVFVDSAPSSTFRFRAEWTVEEVCVDSRPVDWCIERQFMCSWTWAIIKDNCKSTCGLCVPPVLLQERVDALKESWPAQTIMRKHRKRGEVSLAVDDRGEATVASTQEERIQ